jgi:hypothetical protein
VTVEAIDTYVRVTVENFGGPDAPPRIAVTKRQLPKAIEVAELMAQLREIPIGLLDAAHLQACGRAADDAKNNKLSWAV